MFLFIAGAAVVMCGILVSMSDLPDMLHKWSIGY